jgi:hypothetical protein
MSDQANRLRRLVQDAAAQEGRAAPSLPADGALDRRGEVTSDEARQFLQRLAVWLPVLESPPAQGEPR